MLVSFLAYTLAALTIFPLLSFIVIYLSIFLYSKDRKLALHWAITITTFLLLLSVHMTIQQLWAVSVLWLIIILIIIISGGLTYLQYSIRGAIQYDRLINSTIRLIFLLFLPIHILLVIWVIIGKAIDAAA